MLILVKLKCSQRRKTHTHTHTIISFINFSQFVRQSPFPFCSRSFLGKSHNPNKQVLENRQKFWLWEGSFFFLENKTGSRSAFMKQPYYLHNRKETQSSFSRWARPLVDTSCLTSLEWSGEIVGCFKVLFPDSLFCHLFIQYLQISTILRKCNNIISNISDNLTLFFHHIPRCKLIVKSEAQLWSNVYLKHLNNRFKLILKDHKIYN